MAEVRNRLAREMHDGAGGTLVSVLAAIESGTPAREMVADSLREALDEMRFALHALDQPDDSLLGALALARSRLAT